MKRFVIRGAMAAVGVVLLASVARAQAQTPPAAAGDPGMQALVAEVRALRAAVEQLASAGPRIQLFTARLQLQETRVNNMIRRLDAIRDQLASAREEFARADESQKAMEEQLASTTLAGDSHERMALNAELPEQKRHVVALRAKVTALSAEEAQLIADIGSEQARWTDINARLDELERLLAKK